MPVWNGAAFLADAMRSILQQTERDFALLVIDDGSTDDSLRIARSFRDPRVRVVTESRNAGVVARLNQGLEDARSPFVARMDADDFALATRLERQLAFMRRHPRIGICGTWYRTLRDGRPDAVHRLPAGHARLAAFSLFEPPLAHPTAMFRMSHLNRAGLRYRPDMPHVEGHELWERALPLTRLANLPEVLLWCREHPGQVSARQASLQRLSATRLAARALTRRGIPFTAREFQVHAAACAPEAAGRTVGLEEAADWLRKLGRHGGLLSAEGHALWRECRARLRRLG